MKELEFYKAKYIEDRDGDIILKHEDEHAFFYGHLQPVSHNSYKKDYGLELDYNFTLICCNDIDVDICENDLIKYNEFSYIIKTVETYRTHKRFYLKELTNNG